MPVSLLAINFVLFFSLEQLKVIVAQAQVITCTTLSVRWAAQADMAGLDYHWGNPQIRGVLQSVVVHTDARDGAQVGDAGTVAVSPSSSSATPGDVALACAVTFPARPTVRLRAATAPDRYDRS
jgi:hypothetical protein